MAQKLDLLALFQTVASALEDNQESLNKADSYNGDHGDNMVKIFNLVTEAVGEKAGSSPADQLEHAGKLLTRQNSGSAKVYADGLLEASKTFEDRSITVEDAMTLVQTLLGGGNAGDAAKTGSLTEMLGDFLDGDDGEGLDAGDLLNAGLAFFSAKNRGESTSQALIEAVTSASPLGEVPHRAQSSQVVVSTILENLDSFTRK